MKILFPRCILNNIFLSILFSVLLSVSFSSDPCQASPLSPSEQKMILKKIMGEANRHGYLAHAPSNFEKQIESILNVRNLVPSAIAIGFMTRCQVGIGACAAAQINVGIVNHKIHISYLDVVGGEFGEQVSVNAEAYISACYGDCNDEQASGWFIGTDATATAGVGVNVFMDFGVDWSAIFNSRNMDELVKSTVFYAGVGLTTGAGVGLSLGVLRYNVSRVDVLDFQQFLNTPLF